MKTETANDGLVSRTKHLFLGIERGDELSELTNRKNVGYTYKDSVGLILSGLTKK